MARRAYLGFAYRERERAGSGFEPGTFGTEGEKLASELSRQMGNEILISVYVLSYERRRLSPFSQALSEHSDS